MSEQGRANVQAIIDKLVGIGEKVGSWTLQTDARQTGASIHAKFENRVDVFETLEWAAMLSQCPSKLINACERLLLADAEIRMLREQQSGHADA